MFWADIHKLGTTIYHPRYGERVVDDPYVRRVMANFTRLSIIEQYEIPLKFKHTDDGLVHGKIHLLRVEDEHLQALIEVYGEELKKAYNEGKLRKFSPGIQPRLLHPHTGEELTDVLMEVSFTSQEYQMNLRPPQSTNPGLLLSAADPDYWEESIMTLKTTITTPPVAPAPQAPAQFVTVEQLSALETMVKDLAVLVEQKFSNPAPVLKPIEAVPGNAGKDLSADVNALAEQMTRMELSMVGIVEDVDDLVALRQQSPALYSKQIARIVASKSNRQEPLSYGTQPAGTQLPKQPLSELIELARGEVNSDAGIVKWLSDHDHDDRVEEFVKAVDKGEVKLSLH